MSDNPYKLGTFGGLWPVLLDAVNHAVQGGKRYATRKAIRSKMDVLTRLYVQSHQGTLVEDATSLFSTPKWMVGEESPVRLHMERARSCVTVSVRPPGAQSDVFRAELRLVNVAGRSRVSYVLDHAVA